MKEVGKNKTVNAIGTPVNVNTIQATMGKCEKCTSFIFKAIETIPYKTIWAPVTMNEWPSDGDHANSRVLLCYERSKKDRYSVGTILGHPDVAIMYIHKLRKVGKRNLIYWAQPRLSQKRSALAALITSAAAKASQGLSE
uniref:START domain-containing protein n=1 Tax=Steinernema glaseri TaxID=37863 RepID=A0A1I7YJ79_9BILA